MGYQKQNLNFNWNLKIKDIIKFLYFNHNLKEKLFLNALVLLGTFIILLCLILNKSLPTALISPLARTFNLFNFSQQNPMPKQFFSFIPGWSDNNFDNINLNGVQTLAYFDNPINSDGSLDTNNDGYNTFNDSFASELFAKAHANGTKVVITISMDQSSDIESVLNNNNYWQQTISQTIALVKSAGIDGVAIDYEYNGPDSLAYKDKFTNFVRNFTKQMHESIASSQVNVVIPDSALNSNFYNLNDLSQVSDHIYLMAHSFAVPEMQNGQITAPIYGYNQQSYMKNLVSKVSSFEKQVPQDKLALETAWYGNGKDYNLYKNKPSSPPLSENTMKTPLSNATINSLVANVPISAKEQAKENLPYIAKALENDGILNQNVLSYALATIEHETAGTFAPISEYDGTKDAIRYGYEGGSDYYGRGFIQLTHLRNYKWVGEQIGLGDKLVQNPSLASSPSVAAQVLADYFKNNNVAQVVDSGDFVDARSLVNPDDNAWQIASMALAFLNSIT